MGKEVTTKNENLPASMATDMVADAKAGGGAEGIGTDDIAIPFIAILQALSPQIDGETKVEGAGIGMLFNSATEQCYDVEKEEYRIIHCGFEKVINEWVIREKGGGFVAKHAFQEALLEKCPRNEKNQNIDPESGHQMVTTANHFCVLIKPSGAQELVVISFSSTQLKKSRKWIAAMKALEITVNGEKINPPLYSHTYKVSSVPEHNEKGKWRGWTITNPQMVDEKLYAKAKAWSKDVASGKVESAKPVDETVMDDSPTKKESEVL